MSFTEPTARPAVTDDPAAADRPVRVPAESPRAWSQLRSLSVGAAEGSADWADDDRLDELFSAWARAAVADDGAPARFAAADDQSRPVPAEPAELDPPVHFAMARQHLARHRDVGRGPTLESDEAVAVGPTPADEPVTEWTRTDDDIIPTRRGSRRWGRRRG